MTTVTDETVQDEMVGTQALPILPLKGTLVYPYLVVPLMIQDADQTRLVDDALMRGSRIGLFLQKDANVEKPTDSDLYAVGCSGNILKMLRFPDGTVRFLIQGLARIRLKRITTNAPFLTGEVEELPEIEGDSTKLEALRRNFMERIKRLVELAPYLTDEFHVSAMNQDTPSKLTDFVASNLNIAMTREAAGSRGAKCLPPNEQPVPGARQRDRGAGAVAEDSGAGRQRTGQVAARLYPARTTQGDQDENWVTPTKCRRSRSSSKKIEAAKMPEAAEQAARKELDRLSHMARRRPNTPSRAHISTGW